METQTATWASNGTGIYGNGSTTQAVDNNSCNTPLTTNSNFFSTGDTAYWNPNTYYNCYPYWTSYQPNKLEQAFKLAQKLIEKKLIKEPKTVGDFITLVNELTTIL